MRKLLFLVAAFAFIGLNAQAQRTITGKVTDESGAPVSNASVQVKGTPTGTATKADGTFTLQVPQNATTLVISSINMETKEVAIGSQSVINVSLALNASTLETVVVTVPYGTIKKTAFTGSENTISATTIQKQQVASVTRALEGLVPGLIATNGGGAPGTGASVLIRGVGSVSSSSAPLYVLNGVPYDGSISAISTDDIESVTVLKDAAAAALYGSRAANGVIMITTKKGKKGKSVTSATLRQGFMSRGIPEYDRVGIKEYYELFWESYRNSYMAGGDNMATAGTKASNVLAGPNGLVYNAYNVPAAQVVDPTTGKLNPNAQLLWNESWEDALFRNASRTNANFNISGATDKTDYYVSAGFLNEDGIVRFSGYKRYNFRINVNTAATDWLTTGVNLDGAMAERKDVPSGGTATTNPFYYTRQMGPIYPVYQHDLTTGAFVIDPTTGKNMLDWGTVDQMGTRPYAGRSNLLGSLDLDDRSRNIFNGNMNTYAEIKFLKDFSFKATLGVNYFGNNITSYQNNQYGDAAPTPGLSDGGRSTKTNDRQVSLTGNEVLSWSRKFGKHNVRALAGHENYKYQYSYVSANASGFTFPGQTELDNGTGPFGPASSATDNQRIESYFGGVNYDYDQKYLLSGSYRTDGSSRFRDEVRWGNFYSVGVGWRLSEENFLKNVSWINELKFKASYGEQGNENIGLFYPYVSYYYANGNGTYTPPSRPVNADISWETNKASNIGFDFVFFNNRLQGTIEYFTKTSDNLLFDVPLPISTGYSSVWQNIGTMTNKGIDVQLGYTAIRKKNFNWRIDLNMSHFKNEITKLPPIQAKNGIVSGTKKLSEGHGIFDYWLREYAGVDASNGDALYYKDVIGSDGKPTGERVLTNQINQATFYYTGGTSLPDISGGLTNSFNYKNFDLSFLLVFSYGGMFYDGNYAGIMHRGSPGISWSKDIEQRWQKPGDVTTVPRLQNGVAGQDGASTRWLMDGSYLNIKNITLSYNLPKTVANRLHMAGASIFANVDNAALFTAKKGMDPQRAFNGTSDASYTPFRTISFGFNVNLQ
ncbi:MAG: SusC/RagA family TonB-linked outer membrane protein [Terrimonas sp.]|nr:SusC/RagA family TonB-linked outer membrane protein [Terrimonas sp.]